VFVCDELARIVADEVVTNSSANAATEGLAAAAVGDYKDQKAQRRAMQRARRFFIMATRLPIELQMLMCYRAAGSFKNTVLTRNSEPAFQSLATIFMGHPS